MQSLYEAVNTDIESVFEKHPSTVEASHAMIEKLIINLQIEGTITGCTFRNVVSEMAA